MILLTGFEPFGGLARNPTGDLAREFDGDGARGAVLPVDYGRVGPALAELLEEPWEAVVLLGVAVGRSAISLERIAVNFYDPMRTDNTGRTPPAPAVVPGGPAAYFSTLPLDAIHARLAGAGLPVEYSLTAGAYLCNAAFYLARHALDATDTPCGFLHMPPTGDLAAAATPLAFERQREAVREVLSALRSQAQNGGF